MEDEELLASYELEGENFRYGSQEEYDFALKFLGMSQDEFKLMSHGDFLRARDTGALDAETAQQFEREYRKIYHDQDFWTKEAARRGIVQGNISATGKHQYAHKKAAEAIGKRAFEQSRSKLGSVRAEHQLRERKATMSEDEFKLAVFSAKARKRSRQESEAEVAMSFTDMARQDDSIMDFRPEAVLSAPQTTQTASPNGQPLLNANKIDNTAPRKLKTETGGVLDVTNEDVSAVPA